MGADISKQIHLTKKRRTYRFNGKPKKPFLWFFKKKYRKLRLPEEIVDSFPSLYLEEGGINPEKCQKVKAQIVNVGSHFAKECGSTDVSSGSSESDVDITCAADLACIEQAYSNHRELSSSPDSAVDADLSASSCSSIEDCSLCNAANIEYMVETFMTLLQNNLNLKEILPYLHYITDNDAMMLLAMVPQSRAVEHLICIIMHRTNEKGKWTTFLMALDKTGHKYAYQLLKGETERDHFYSSKLLKIMKPELINRIYLSEIIDPLFAREVINEEDKDEIESAEKNRGPLEATRILLNKVDKRLPNWDTEFADVLEKAGMAEIADIFKMVEHHTHIDERDTIHFNSKRTIKQSSNRKIKKGKRRCQLHKQSKSPAKHGSLGEPEIKRIRTQGYPFFLSGIDEEATIDVKGDEMQSVLTELQTSSTSPESNIVMPKDLLGKMDTLINLLTAHSTKSVDEQALMKKQIEDQNHMIECMNETLTKLLMCQQNREVEKDQQIKDAMVLGQSSRARIRRWRVQVP